MSSEKGTRSVWYTLPSPVSTAPVEPSGAVAFTSRMSTSSVIEPFRVVRYTSSLPLDLVKRRFSKRMAA